MPRAVKVKEEEETVEVQEETEAPEVEDVLPDEESEDSLIDEEEWDSRKMPPEEELWDDGPNFGMINAWKDQFGDVYVTSVTHDKHVVWRTLNRFEYRRMVKQLEQAVASGQMSQAEANMNNEEAIAELCVLFPQYSRANPTGEMAGLASTITQQIMEASAFTAVEVRQL